MKIQISVSAVAPVWTAAKVKSAILKAIKDLNKYRRQYVKKELLDAVESDVPAPEDWQFNGHTPKSDNPKARIQDQTSMYIHTELFDGSSPFKKASVGFFLIRGNLYRFKAADGVGVRLDQLTKIPDDAAILKYLIQRFAQYDKGSDDDFGDE
jgi:hypothetical protein